MLTFQKRVGHMRRIRRTFAWLSIVSVSTASFCGCPSYAAHQKDSSCSEARDAMDVCTGFNTINPERGKPFAAERVVRRMVSSIRSAEQTELVARDSNGRIRDERHVPAKTHSHRGIMALGGVPSSQRDLITIDEPEELMVSILDCFGGQRIRLMPNEQIAFVQEPCAGLPAFQLSDYPYSYRLTQLVTTNMEPNLVVEDLGYQEFQAGKARGVRFTRLEEQRDGDGKRKPKAVQELWMSDELGATVSMFYSDLVTQTEVSHTLQNIRREEPDASLFTLPSGYNLRSWSTMWRAVY